MNSASDLSIDISQLAKLRHHPSGKITARCPACAEEGRDRTGNHLAVFPGGGFACIVHHEDREHRKRIVALVGRPSSFTRDLADTNRQRKRLYLEQRRAAQLHRLVETARSHRHEIVRRFAWPPADVWHDSPQRIDSSLVGKNPAHFLASLFNASDLLWTGGSTHSGSPVYATRWKQCVEWSKTADPIGPMTTPTVWKPGTNSRSRQNVQSAPYTVLDFDGFDGIAPTTRDELSRHTLDSLALIRWLRDHQGWRLAAILGTGGKSLHAWFYTPPPETLESLIDASLPLGIDRTLLGHPEHPCRLPGQRYGTTARLSEVLWLQTPL